MAEVIEKTIFKDLEINELSPTSKIYLVGRYAEILFRFDQKLSDQDYFTLGKGADSFKGPNSTKYITFENHFNNLRDLRNKCVHTQNLYVATETEFESAKDVLYYLFSFLFFKYFLNIRFGKNEHVMRLFSILPPKLRAITLGELLNYDKNNIFLIDKAMLAMVKSNDPEAADKVLEDNSDFLKNNIDDFLGESHYNLLREKLKSEKEYFLNCNKMYNNLPEAGTYYKKERENFVALKDKDIDELIVLMDFIYKGF